MTRPIVFVETNFIISLLFPHLDYDKYDQANKLFGRNGIDCTIYIPAHSIFESLATVRNKTKQIKEFATEFDNLYRAGVLSPLDPGILRKLKEHSDYNFEEQRLSYVNQLNHIHVDEEIFRIVREEILGTSIFTKGDTIDAYILASIFRACSENLDTPKIFMSTNKNDFKDIPTELLSKYKLIYFSSFNLETALHLWRETFMPKVDV